MRFTKSTSLVFFLVLFVCVLSTGIVSGTGDGCVPVSEICGNDVDDDCDDLVDCDDPDCQPCITVRADKVVCNSESDLPNWGGESGPHIDFNTASNYVGASSGNCRIAEWDFQWRFDGDKPDDNALGVPDGWTSFDSGSAITIYNADDGTVWFREKVDPAYHSFSNSLQDDVTAEFYCDGDVLNYDNYDYIKEDLSNNNGNFYCVGFNALICDADSDCDDGDSCTVDTCDNEGVCYNDFVDKEGPSIFDLLVGPMYNNGVFNVTATVEDGCSPIRTAEYFLRHSGSVDCGTPGTGTEIYPTDGSFGLDELREYVEAGDVEFFEDGSNRICMQGQDEQGIWGDCVCYYYESDTWPPELIYDVSLNDVEDPDESLICGDNPMLYVTICDSQSDIQGGEFFLNMLIPPMSVPAPWSGYWLSVLSPPGQYYDGGWHCADLSGQIDQSDFDGLGEGTHYINQIRGKDVVENWGKVYGQNFGYSFIKDTKAPLVYKELLLFEDVSFGCQWDSAMGHNLNSIYPCQFVKSGTQVRLSADDSTFVDDHEFAGDVVIHYNVYWSDKNDLGPSQDPNDWELNASGHSMANEDITFTLTGDSYHLVEYWAVDDCGYSSEHYWELDVIDGKAPVTTKTIEGPQVGGDGSPIHKYITEDTTIILDCQDQEPHPIGGEVLYWEVFWSEECVDPDWSFEPIRYGVEDDGHVEISDLYDSCHKLVYYCVDKLGNTEIEQIEIDAVDNTEPEIIKTVGEPRIDCDEVNVVNGITTTTCGDGPIVDDQCWYMTDKTEITLTCYDQNPHPVDDVTIYWYWDWWNNQEGGRAPLEGYNSHHGNEITFTYTEDCWHTLYYWCEDSLGNVVERMEYDVVDTLPPESEHEFDGPTYENEGKFYIDGVTELILECEDLGPHPVGWEYIKFRYRVDEGNWNAWTNYGGPFVFPEESHHELEYYCVDRLGNEELVNEADFYVDHTKPVTTKTYGLPFYTDGTSKWITQNTPITLSADDGDEIHDSGVYETYYRWEKVDDDNCYSVCDEVIDGSWDIYYDPFYISEDSCHLIEYYSVDNVEKTEVVNRQCIFVDTQAPETVKTVGEPKIPLLEQLDIYYDEGWLVNGSTEITFDCNDVDPHPVNDVTMYWRWKYSEFGEVWTDWSENIIYDGSPITFSESSYHMIEYWCVDALGNEEEHTFELDAVDLTPPESWKEIGEPSILIDPDCNPQEEICDYWITQGTGISLFCEDIGPHPSGVDEIFWRYDLDGEGFGDWMVYGNPITFGEDSNHTLEWYCVDNFGNEEAVRSELDVVDTQGPNVTRKFARVNDGEIIKGGSVGDEVVIAITSDDTIKLCAEVVDLKETGDAGVGILEVWYQFIGLDDPGLVWDPSENAYCVVKNGDEIRECGGDCGWWRFEVYGIDLLGNVGEQTNGLEIIVDNVPPMGVVLNPHAGNYYRDGVPFQVYAPAVDFGGDSCSMCYYGYEDDCPASGVDYCDLYAIDYDFEGMNQDEIKECYRDLWTYFQQVGANPNVVYLGQVPYEDGVCKGTVALPEEGDLGYIEMTDTVFLGIDYVDKAGNQGNELFGYHLQLALNPWFSPITMNIDNDGPLVSVIGSNLPGPLTSSGDGDNVFIEAEVIEYASGFDGCWAEVYYTDGLGELGGYVGVADLEGTKVDFDSCRINKPLSDGLESGDYLLKIIARDEKFNIGSVVVPMIVDNTRPTMSVVSPAEEEVYGIMFPVSLNVEDSQSPIADETVMFRINSESPGFWNIWCIFGTCEDTGWIALTKQANGLYADTVNLTEHGITGDKGTYYLGAYACDNLYEPCEDSGCNDGLGWLDTDRNKHHCKSILDAEEELRFACDDGIDNDLDGDVDSSEDRGCYSSEDDDEESVCGNGYVEEGEDCEDDGDCGEGFSCGGCICHEQGQSNSSGGGGCSSLIKINEFVANPVSGNDWVELYNNGSSSVDLSGWRLNDSGSEMESLSGSIAVGGFVVVDVSNRLNQGGDAIKLIDSYGFIIDEVTYGTGAFDAPVPYGANSTGRSPDGQDTDVDSADFYIFTSLTQGNSNPVFI